MLPPDNHVHSQWSYDTGGQASMRAACRQAVRLGVPAVAFTEHVDALRWAATDVMVQRGLHQTPWDRVHALDVPGYLASIDDCRRRFPELRILTGIETGEPHLNQSTLAAVLAQGRFDRILGSLHLAPIGSSLVDAPLALQRAGADGVEGVMRSYFAEMVRLIEGSDIFQVLAHLDFPRRYWPKEVPAYDEGVFQEEYRCVLRALAGTGRALEINTRSPMASKDLLRWWREEGGRAVSFGSDAHVPWRVGEHFATAQAIAESEGFSKGRDAFDFWRR